MTFPDTVPTWMTSTAPVPDCPPWCVEPAGHGFIAYPAPGMLELDRDHDAFRADVTRTDGKTMTVTVYVHENSSPDEGLHRSPLMVFIDGTEGLDLSDLVALNVVLRDAEAVFTRITGGRA